MNDGIFISYKRKDSAALAGRLYDHLSGWFPGRVFMDVAGISPGHDFRERLTGVMSQCRVVVVLIGPSWEAEVRTSLNNPTTADYFLIELEQALASDLVVIPLLIDGTTMPSTHGLPETIQALQFRHALDVRTSCFVRDISPLQATICHECGLVSPTLWEQLIDRIPGLTTSNEPTRNSMAITSMVFTLIGIVGVVLRHACSPQSFIMFFVACALGLVGINSRRRWWLAWVSMLLSVGGIIVSLWSLAGGRIVFS